jgi:dTDP-4-amino-4,6-dideoxygalactose transaminase
MKHLNLFEISPINIDTSKFTHVLHDEGVEDFERVFANFVGAKYACGFSSASMAIYVALSKFTIKGEVVKIPSMIPPVVPNAVFHANRKIEFYDDVQWVGGNYSLHRTGWKGKPMNIIDSAQEVRRNQYSENAKDQDIMIFSFYPTKPVGGLDGGMVVTDSKEVYELMKSSVMYGMAYSKNSWDREVLFPGWKGYLSSVQAYAARQSFDTLEERQEQLESIKKKYRVAFAEKNLLPFENPGSHLFRIAVGSNEKFIAHMRNQGVICGIHYSALHDSRIYSKMCRTKKECGASSFYQKKTVSIPFHHKLKSFQQEYIIDLVSEWADSSRQPETLHDY